MRKVLPESFFARSAVEVAPDLLGKYLVRRIGGSEVASMIVETEAYEGMDDLACHASKGRTKRTEALFGKPGRFYVYPIYGIHTMVNVVTHSEGHPSGVLLRGVEDAIGPGRLTRAFSITRELYGKPAVKASGLWLEDRGVVVHPSQVLTTPRIGVAYAGPVWAYELRRFVYVSGE